MSTMRHGVHRLAGAFPIASLNQSSRLFSSSSSSLLCHSVPRHQDERDYGANWPQDHNGQPLSKEALVIAREYWRLQQIVDFSSTPLQSNLLHEIQSHRKAYTSIVLGANGSHGPPITRTYEPPYVEPVQATSFQLVQQQQQQLGLPTQPPSYNGFEDERPSLSPEQEAVVALAALGHNIFYTGSAGSGKSTVLHAIRDRLRLLGRQVQVVAPTGKAASNVNGLTTWSFAGWSPSSMRESIIDLVLSAWLDNAVVERIRETDVFIIDEISMVENHHFERLNTVFKVLRADPRPFGGVQIIVVGDFCQLPPVLPFQLCYQCGSKMTMTGRQPFTRYTCDPCNLTFSDAEKWVFYSRAWQECNFTNIHLQSIHRQRDPTFISMLEKCRVGVRLTPQEVDLLVNHRSDTKNATRLYPRRLEARIHNEREFKKLPGYACTFRAHDSFHWERKLHPTLGHLNEAYPDGTLKALADQVLPAKLELKIGMPVVLFQNLDVRRGLCNGSQGEIIDFERCSDFKPRYLNDQIPDGFVDHPYADFILAKEHLFTVSNRNRSGRELAWPVVQFANGETRTIKPITRITEFGSKKPYSLLSRTQIPLGPAWAMTIHRAQGMTMDRVIVDLTSAFVTGQAYVALSRARSLEGLKVEGNTRHLLAGMGMDQAVREFLTRTFGPGWTGGRMSEVYSLPAAAMRYKLELPPAAGPDAGTVSDSDQEPPSMEGASTS
ncbi:P-loop containing nucleoside triphosphate hydrolase protein [Pseudoneurospora amorphoporcata]|uniref:ATP-dependent DNA helicase n=1 Tax=Pseudoneurospora amorphoporcata TaxID=241081 RepID=A0AAN6NLS7_9PEZI|nr:P-loop containing nucleoside triphosphate hydrolase protein [Pseudoneurospora amorphoporcata]